jgi:hypothetical protein
MIITIFLSVSIFFSGTQEEMTGLLSVAVTTQTHLLFLDKIYLATMHAVSFIVPWFIVTLLTLNLFVRIRYFKAHKQNE